MTVFGMYFPTEVFLVFVSTLAAILLTHLAICIVFGFFDLQKYSMSWLLPVSLAACVLYIPSLLAEPMVLLLYFALAVFSVVRYIGLKKTLARCQEAGTLKIFHLVPHGGTNYVHGAVSAAPIIMQENYGMDLSGKIFVGDDLILSNIGFLFEPDAEYEIQCEKVGGGRRPCSIPGAYHKGLAQKIFSQACVGPDDCSVWKYRGNHLVLGHCLRIHNGCGQLFPHRMVRQMYQYALYDWWYSPFLCCLKSARKGKNPPSDYESAFLYHALLHNPVYLWYCAGQGRDVSAVYVNLKEFSAI